MRKRTVSRLSFEEREEKILKAAINLFSEKGYKGATTKALARKAGINEALIFRHFPDKSGLYTALLQKKLKETEQDFLPEFEIVRHQPLEEGLLYLSRKIIARFKKNQPYFRMMLFTGLENHPLSQWILRQRLPIPEVLRDFLREKLGDGHDHEVEAKAFFGILFHYAIVTQIFQSPDYFPKSEDELLKEYVEIFAKGIRS